MVRRFAAAVTACLLAAGAITLTAAGDRRQPAATVPGATGISDARLAALVEAVDVGAVPAQFTRAEVTAHVLTELVGLEIDESLATDLGVTPDLATARRLTAQGSETAGGAGAFQQQLLRDPGAGWAGADVYELDHVLQAQLARAEAETLDPLPEAALRQAYADRLGRFAHAHVEILTTPDPAVAAADARAARADPAVFPTLVRRDTDDDTHRASGGDYGPALARGQLFANVDDAIFGARAGAVIGPIEVAEARPEYYVVRVLAVTDIPLAAATPTLRAILLNPAGSYVAAALTRARQAEATGVRVRPDLGSWDPGQLAVSPVRQVRPVSPDAPSGGAPPG